MDIVTPEMIQRFLNNKSEDSEAGLVAAFLKSHPEVLERYTDDKQIWQAAAHHQLPREIRGKRWRRVKARIDPPKRRRLYWAAAAACIIAVLAGVYFFRINSVQVTYPDIDQTVASGDQLRVHRIGNNSSSLKDVQLPDGSVVILRPNSSICYKDSFRVARNLTLKGSAYFKVAHDGRHPFTVYCDSIGTTALGTEFWVITGERDIITIQLEEGKVLVRPHKTGIKNIYLSPGDRVDINRDQLMAKVIRKKITASEVVHADQVHIAPRGKSTWTNSAYTFTKSSLSLVFLKLQTQYKVQIKFDQADIKNSQFTGKIMYSDPLDVVLQTICNLNDLQYHKTGDTIYIDKK